MTKENQTQPVSGAMTDEFIDVAARKCGLDGSMLGKPRYEYWREFARAILSRAKDAQAVRNAALEEAAKICDNYALMCHSNTERRATAKTLSSSIRLLQSAPAQPVERPDGISPAAYDRLHALCESQAARIIELEQSIAANQPQQSGNVQEPVAWMDLHAELGKMRWLGADEGWDAAIEAVRKRLVELAAAPQVAQVEGECLSCVDGKCTTGKECVATSNPPQSDAQQSIDTERLDFLEKHSVIAKPGQKVRAAIDAAIAKESK